MTTPPPLHPDAAIMIVDDEPANVALLRAALKHGGYTNVQAYTGGAAALTVLAAGLPDLLLLDLNMPRPNGFDVLDDIAVRYAGTFVPTIVLTADGDRKVRDSALIKGAIDFLLKPVDITELLLRVANVLRTRRLHAELENERQLLAERVADRTRGLELSNRQLAAEKESLERTQAAERELERRLAHLAFHDPLTGLANRLQLTDTLREHVDSDGPTVGLLLLDLDDFKSLNDTIGHGEGDAALRRVAAVIESRLEPNSLAARLGGDEFAVLIRRPDAEAYLQQLARCIGSGLEERFTLAGRELSLHASVGIATGDPGEVSADELLRRADVAMYFAKRRKPSNASNYEEGMDAAMVNRLAMISDLETALARHEFFLEYQPIIDLASDRLAGFEALIRWQHPVLGLLPPDNFIPVSEDSGWIRRIGDWVAQEALGTIARLRQKPGFSDLYVTVNASPVELREETFTRQIAHYLERNRLAPSALIIEVTERVAIDAKEDHRPLKALHDLRALGVGIALDDFGTGYSSLSYLRNLPLTALKIDKSFVEGIGRDTVEERIIAAIIALANAMSLDTIAEGIEEPQQADWLEDAKCTKGQGYLISRPIAASELDTYIATMTSAAA